MLSVPKFLSRHPIGTGFTALVIGVTLVAFALILPQPDADVVSQPETPIVTANELDTLDKGPAVGTSIPHQFNAPDQNNEIRSFTSLKAKNGLIVLFSRSFDW
jgi:hypothetical protein